MNNTQSKNKTLVIIIGILLIANIVTLSFLLLNKNQEPRSARADRRAQLTAFLKNNAGFTQEQLSLYDTLSRKHRTEMRAGYDELATGREAIFKRLATQSFNDSAMENASKEIAVQQKEFELNMLRHLKEIRNICTPAQLPIFDTGFYKIISKRGDRKDKSKQ